MFILKNLFRRGLASRSPPNNGDSREVQKELERATAQGATIEERAAIAKRFVKTNATGASDADDQELIKFESKPEIKCVHFVENYELASDGWSSDYSSDDQNEPVVQCVAASDSESDASDGASGSELNDGHIRISDVVEIIEPDVQTSDDDSDGSPEVEEVTGSQDSEDSEDEADVRDAAEVEFRIESFPEDSQEDSQEDDLHEGGQDEDDQDEDDLHEDDLHEDELHEDELHDLREANLHEDPREDGADLRDLHHAYLREVGLLDLSDDSHHEGSGLDDFRSDFGIDASEDSAEEAFAEAFEEDSENDSEKDSENDLENDSEDEDRGAQEDAKGSDAVVVELASESSDSEVEITNVHWSALPWREFSCEIDCANGCLLDEFSDSDSAPEEERAAPIRQQWHHRPRNPHHQPATHVRFNYPYRMEELASDGRRSIHKRFQYVDEKLPAAKRSKRGNQF